MAVVPTGSVLVTQVALPEAATACAPQPAIVTPAAVKFTVPVRVPDAGAIAETVAVKVTLAPVLEGLTDETSAFEVMPWFTVCARVAEVEPVKLPSPL